VEVGGTNSIAAKDNDLPPAPAIATNGNYLHHILTHREMDVLRLLDQRLTNKEIARNLGISAETVRQHTIRLFRKLNVENRRQAIVVARSLGLDSNGK
jgi:ATP/maltotriose-dependent transcriptional regulator MalT